MVTDKAAEQGQLVSIICRTIGRSELEQALNSVIAQTYPKIELVLVNAAAGDLSGFSSLYDALNVVHVAPDESLTRSQSANAGLEAASGKYIMFLDDDDWIAEEHVQNLVNFIAGQSTIKAAYSSVQKTDSAGNNIPYVFASDYDPIVLMRDNYIPIHAVLFDRTLLDANCRFDESLDIYEDWDFWLQLSQHTDFHHLDAVTAFYRQGGDSDTAVDDARLRYRSDNALGKSRATIFSKWKSQWSGEAINHLFGDLDQSSEINDLANQLDSSNKRLEEEFKKSDKLSNVLTKTQRDLDQSRQETHLKEVALAEKQHELTNKQLELTHIQLELTRKLDELAFSKQDTEKHLKLHIAELEHALHLVHSSLSWRVTRPLRGLKALVSGGPKSAAMASADSTSEPVVERTPEVVADAAIPTPVQELPDQIVSNGQDAKAAHDRQAKAELKKFLASDELLNFPAEEGVILTIVLVFYNQAQLSLLCLRSLLEHADVSYRLTIVDNNSSDDTGKLLDRLENVLLIRNDANLGFVKAVNQAAAQSDTDYLLLLNNDALIEDDTLSTAVDTIRNDKLVGAVGARIELLDGSLQEAGSIIWSDGSCLGYGRGQNPNDGEFMYQRDVDYCSGAFLLFRHSDFVDLGGFDEVFAPAYYEESDFCIRLQESGKRIVYNPRVRLTHYEFASSGGMQDASKLQQAHQQILCDKHPEFLANRMDNSSNNALLARTANKHPNILLIDDRVPHPSLGSGYPRCAQLLNSLSKLDLNISFYPLQFPIDDWSDVYETLDRTIEVLLGRGRAGLSSFLQERRGFYQFVVVSRVHNMECFNSVVDQESELLEGCKVFYDAEAVFAPREIMKMELLGQYISEEDKQKLIAKELEQALSADSVIAVSESEASLYRDAGAEDTVILGHTLQVNPGSSEFDERQGLLFVGALRDEGSPNVDSLLWFVINVLPLIEREIPDIELLVVGDSSAPSLASIKRDNIKLAGRLDSIEASYNKCRVFIAPTRFAAGIPHKVHEAAAHGIPSVTTDLLAEQLGWNDEDQLLVADTAEHYAAQCVRLYQDSELWNKVRAAGLAAVAEDCSDEKFQATLKSLFP